MQLNNNFFIHSLAGSGKTTRLVKYALKFKDQKILITTFTNKNIQEIKNKFYEIHGFIPANVKITTWYSFLLDECCRPYQKSMGIEKRITNIRFVPGTSAPYSKANDIKHYFDKTRAIYNDKIAKFAYNCIKNTPNVINRLEKICDYLFIDEAQDLSGFDFEILNNFLQSNLKIIMVGDSRQNTFNTSHTVKNKKFAQNIHEWFLQKQSEQKGILKYLNKCWRCNAQICSFADTIYPEFEKAISKNKVLTGHDGLFYLRKKHIEQYYEKYSPTTLINDIRAKKNVPDIPTLNFGLSKGITVDRVIVVPTDPIMKYLKNGQLMPAREKFYIAATRARYSVAFLVDDNVKLTSFHFSEIQEYVP